MNSLTDIFTNTDLGLLYEQIGLLSELEVDMRLSEEHRDAVSGVLNLLGPLHQVLENEL
jgi:hypothetical protein